MAFYSDDPIADFDRHDREQQAWEDNLPHCDRCKDPIDDFFWEIDDRILCEDCAKLKYRRGVV